MNVCERGMAAMLAQELLVGETVAIEVPLSSMTSPLRLRAIVRHQDKLRIGLQFVGLSADQRDAIRNWAKEAKAESEVSPHRMFSLSAKSANAGEGKGQSLSRGAPRPRRKRSGLGGMIFLVFVAFAAGVFWWRWNQGWEQLEAGLRNSAMASAEKPQAQVSAEVMQKLLVHRVEPIYPAEARKANLQGIIALDVVVGRDGSVVKMHALNGPEVLARAAMDALRWWKFEPYRVNGEPAVVETTVAVEFKR